MHPKICMEIIVDKKVIGYLGELHPLTLKEYDLKQQVYAFEFNVKNLEKQFSAAEFKKAKDVPSLPSAWRDLSFIIDENTQYADILNALKDAPAKINLSLKVQGKREDGYHNVDILMAKLDLADELSFHNSRTTTLLCDTPGVPTDESNLVIKAVREFEKAYGRKAKQKITLNKKVPFGAGLGGGSADAAVTLLAVNEIIGTQYTHEELHAMAAAIGSDGNGIAFLFQVQLQKLRNVAVILNYQNRNCHKIYLPFS